MERERLSKQELKELKRYYDVWHSGTADSAVKRKEKISLDTLDLHLSEGKNSRSTLDKVEDMWYNI